MRHRPEKSEKMQSDGSKVGGAGSREKTPDSQRGRHFTIPHPIAEEEQQQPQSSSDSQSIQPAGFIDSMKKFFAPCVGAVDAASVYIEECQPSKYETCDLNQQDNVADDVIMRLRERNGGIGQHGGKRRNDTLEIPTNGILFDDDDVSAISAHTLEEMERLRIQMAQNNKLMNFQMSPNRISTKAVSQHSRGAEKAPDAFNEGNLSICVSASDSSSSQGVEENMGSPQFRKFPPTWSNEIGKDQDFKIRPVG